MILRHLPILQANPVTTLDRRPQAPSLNLPSPDSAGCSTPICQNYSPSPFRRLRAEITFPFATLNPSSGHVYIENASSLAGRWNTVADGSAYYQIRDFISTKDPFHTQIIKHDYPAPEDTTNFWRLRVAQAP